MVPQLERFGKGWGGRGNLTNRISQLSAYMARGIELTSNPDSSGRSLVLRERAIGTRSAVLVLDLYAPEPSPSSASSSLDSLSLASEMGCTTSKLNMLVSTGTFCSADSIAPRRLEKVWKSHAYCRLVNKQEMS